MNLRNYEFKARAQNLNELEQKLLELNPVFKGEDHQIDTYFNVPNGRLKLREGIIENALIYYERPDIPDSKQSAIILYKLEPDRSLKDILIKVMGIKVVVDKIRKIYFIGNVKFHFDIVRELGTYFEVEAIDETGNAGPEELEEQCKFYFDYFGLSRSDYIKGSYSDLILEKLTKNKTFTIQ